MSPTTALYDYYRSSAAFRVRIALNIKGLPYEQRPLHLTRDGGDQHREAYRAINPQGLVPALADDGELYTQSLAIIEYLEDKHPQPPILPWHPNDRAYVRAIALQIACDIHPLNNLRVLDQLRLQFNIDDAQRLAWMHHWLHAGFAALERRLAGDPHTGRYCFGENVTIADIFLVPQVYNARRFELPLAAYPTIVRIADEASKLDAFRRAVPENQPDAE
ncbi:maleylacetoacetate isomerase [Hydrocarboniphaga sp.]|uniref:maleylacetoacetate isomerase n=1 Tax=Hydrocarboniphaga sp. TaxID=2033016 RepID=UPI003D0D3B67